jgi:drug/metabolite transporter (DMT)-like permease
MNAREWGLLALLSLLWGGSYFFVGVAVKEIPPMTLVTLRVGFAAALLWVCAPLLGVALPRSGKAVAALAVLGFGNNALPFALITWGQTHLASGLASILVAATPLFSVLAGHILTAEEKLSGLKLLGTLAGMAGVAWLIGPDMLFGAANHLWAELALLAAALSYALAAVYARRVRSLGLKPIDVAAGQATNFCRRSRSPSTRPGPFRRQARRLSPPCSGSLRFPPPSPTSSISAFWPARVRPTYSWSRS